MVGMSMGWRLGRCLTFPPMASFLFNAVFALWYLPVFYERALWGHASHTLELLVFMTTAVIL
jgi:cytochrome c oxidase assembly factor CtaG